MKLSQKKRDLVEKVLQNELARAEGGEQDDLAKNREEALKYYLAKPRGDEIEGRSTVISTDVADMVNAVLAMLVPMLSTDAVVEFEPLSEEDEQGAQAESQAVNKLILEDNEGFIEIQEAVKDALLLKNACMKIDVVDMNEVEKLELPDELPPEQIAALLEPRAPRETREADGSTVTVKREVRRFEVSAVPIERISYQAGYCGKLQDIRFIAERVDLTRSDLVERGVPKAKAGDLQAYSDASDTGAEQQRKQSYQPGRDAETRDQDQIDCHQCYVLIDLDGDGISERYRALIANRKTLLEIEGVDLVPYALGSAFLNAHQLTGESLFDHLKGTQDRKTKLRRQFLDNVAVINNGLFAYDPDQTNEDDVFNRIAGGGIRSRDPVNSVVPIPVPDVTAGILAALQYEDKERTEKGGASLDLMSADSQLVGETAHGIERQYASREAMASMMAKNLSETLIRNIYTLTHEFLRRFSIEPVMVRISGQYMPMDPRGWPKRTRVNVTAGMSPGARGHLQTIYSQALQMQFAAIQNGANGVLADLQTIHRTVSAWMRVAGVDNPERHWIDPSSPAAQEAAQRNAQAQQQAEAAQAEMVERQIGIEEEKIRSTDGQKAGELQFKYDELAATVEIEEAKLTTDGVVKIETQRLADEAEDQRAERAERRATSSENSARGDAA